MTQAVRYRCQTCALDFGILGFHGLDLATRSGELPVECRRCPALFVGTCLRGVLPVAVCPRCADPLHPSAGRCPGCDSDRLVFRDLSLPFETWIPAGNLAAVIGAWQTDA